jgi:hypothetical protein
MIQPVLQAAYHQVVKAPITETIRSIKKQWDDLLDSVPFVQWQPAPDGVGAVSSGQMIGIAEESTMYDFIKNTFSVFSLSLE